MGSTLTLQLYPPAFYERGTKTLRQIAVIVLIPMAIQSARWVLFCFAFKFIFIILITACGGCWCSQRLEVLLFLDLEVQVVVNQVMGVLGIKPRSSRRAIHAFNL